MLARVDFGRYDADHDDNILDYFLEVGTAGDATKGKYLVIGRKGSGKTALFRHLAATLPARVVQLDLENYVFQAHKGLKEIGVAEAFAYTASWRFAIAISMFLKVRPDLPYFKRKRGMKILKKIGLGPNGGPLAAIVDWLSRVKQIALPSVTGLFSLGSVSLGDQKVKTFDNTTAQFLEEIEQILVDAAKVKPITALVDRLDDAWDGSEESLRLITGAVRAARHFANKIKQPGAAPVIVFLRTDLWEKIQFNDKNKTSQDLIYLDWSDSDLARVIDFRIHKTAGVSEGAGWVTLFTNDKMRQSFPPQKYILKRALGRPRDVVAFASLAREVALKEGHSIVERADIYDAEVLYSKHILDELKDEIGGHVDDVGSVINTLKLLDRRTFTLKSWSEAATKSGMSQDEAESALEHLFEASAVGVLRAGGKTGGSSTVYRYQDRFLKATETGNLQVHLGLTKELSLTDA